MPVPAPAAPRRPGRDERGSRGEAASRPCSSRASRRRVRPGARLSLPVEELQTEEVPEVKAVGDQPDPDQRAEERQRDSRPCSSRSGEQRSRDRGRRQPERTAARERREARRPRAEPRARATRRARDPQPAPAKQSEQAAENESVGMGVGRVVETCRRGALEREHQPVRHQRDHQACERPRDPRLAHAPPQKQDEQQRPEQIELLLLGQRPVRHERRAVERVGAGREDEVRARTGRRRRPARALAGRRQAQRRVRRQHGEQAGQKAVRAAPVETTHAMRPTRSCSSSKQRRDQEAREDEEQIDAVEAAERLAEGMDPDHGEDRDAAQTVEGGHVADALHIRMVYSSLRRLQPSKVVAPFHRSTAGFATRSRAVAPASAGAVSSRSSPEPASPPRR